MKCNVGYPDRMVRVFVGVVLTLFALLGMAGAWSWIGLPLLATGLSGFCPLYAVLGLQT